ncbi:MAG TPA: cytochrome P450 [Burkholderiales bacterium]|nr:cytochrome P450 [Burkholderiales bacterium]
MFAGRTRPPGPRGLPLIGAARSFARDPLAFLTGVAEKYGDIANFRLGWIDVYFVRHPDYVREVLITQRASFTMTSLRARINAVVGEGLFTSRGELHARQQRLMLPVFRKSRIEAYAGQMAELSRRARDQWQSGTTVDIADEMMKLTMLIAAQALFEQDIGSETGAVSRNIGVVLEFFTRLSSPFLKLSLALPLPSSLRFRNAVRDLDAVIYRMIERRRDTAASGKDLLSLLMQARDDETHVQMTEKQLRDEVLTLLIAGHETTANVLAWIFYLLARHPAAEQRLHEEARAVLAGRAAFTAADIDRLVWTHRVMQEGLRLYPPGWFIGREAQADVRLGGYTVPRGAVVMMSQYVTHRDARFFEEPERFDPERWEGGLQDRLPRGAYFPFSAGDRHCIGEGFAWQEALLILATLLERWKFELVPGQNIRPRPSVTLRPDGPIKMIVRPR